MKRALSTWTGVFTASTLTTVACMIVSEVMVYLLFPGQDLLAALQIAPLISLVTAYPFSFFIWSQVRRNIQMGIELQRLVNRDRLTDVATRDFFFARMRSDPQAYGISLMVDIDFFKTVNDTFGHMAGDAVIVRVAEILHQNTRANDIVCRFGGEEFVVFLREKGSSDGFDIAERMRKAISDDVVVFDGQNLSVTVSIGGSMKERLADVNLAIQQADRALYRAKSLGRNRTIFSEPTDLMEERMTSSFTGI
ncbi:GGDEF domain-containing protein [Yoonia sp. F2084L]|uniref:GGDEF domain-containing protein n=1 Tax=Yoonia sp. F2084L TaxID=2926419 RepID=UPI001FF54408|nr:GGDEF domain-containing protein [Yoonia sp. F2084L]MCK0094038.1 GGDEF domain-containing protein [Yoonia sp. F2084L]